MSQSLHNIDRPEGKYSNLELDEFMVFCILDTSVPYEKCCQAFDALKKAGMTTREGLYGWNPSDITKVLKSVGYRWATQKGFYLHEFAYNNIDLKKASREEIVKNIKGVGMKLASMFLRNTRGHEYAVIDVHTDRWLKGYFEDKKFVDVEKLSYEQKEDLFRQIAEDLETTITDLDLAIWRANRIGNRSKK